MNRTALVLVSLCALVVSGCAGGIHQRIYDAEQDGLIHEGMSVAEVEGVVGRPPDEQKDAVARYDDVLVWTPMMQFNGGYGRFYTFRIKGGKLESMSVRDDGNSGLAIKKRYKAAPVSDLGPGI